MTNLGFGINEEVLEIHPTGSYYICNPPVTNTDRDYLVLCEDMERLQIILEEQGWDNCLDSENEYQEELEYGISWRAYRKDNINLMISSNIDWYQNSVTATNLCKELNVQDKDRRIRIFRYFKYGEELQVGDIPSLIRLSCPTCED